MTGHTDSYYAASCNDRNGFRRLTSNLRVDVAIVGGGFSGISTALELTERGLKVAVLEAKLVGWGATGRNGGQVTGSLSGDVAMAREFRRSIGAEADGFIWNLRWHGHDIIRNRVEKYGIQCDLKFGQMQTAMKPQHMKELQATYDAGCERGMDASLSLLNGDQVRDYLETELYCGGLLNRKNMHLHPLNLCLGEARAAERQGAMIFEDAEVLRIEHGSPAVLVTAGARVTADTVLIAGNALHLLEQKSLGGGLFPASLSVMATEPLGEDAERINPRDIAVYDSRFVLDYYRLTADRRLLFGGGTNYSGRPPKSIADDLRPAMEKTFPRLRGRRIDHAWNGIDGIILNRIPQVGKIRDNVFYVQGYSGHGIALTHIMGELMAEAITGTMSRFDVFAKVRHSRLPFGRQMGSHLVALGMIYYRIREALR